MLVLEICEKTIATFRAQASQTVMVTPQNLKRNGHLSYLLGKNMHDSSHFASEPILALGALGDSWTKSFRNVSQMAPNEKVTFREKLEFAL